MNAIQKANQTSRSRGAVGKDPLCYRYVRETWPLAVPGLHILDYGAGRDAVHAKKLRRKGLDVVAYDFGVNLTDAHDPDALEFAYDVVIASNVLNVQSSRNMLARTLNELTEACAPGGILVCNYPSSPRYLPEVDAKGIERRLERRGFSLLRVDGTKQAPVFRCVKVM